MRPISYRTLPLPLRASVGRVVRAVRYALRVAGRGSAVHAWTDNPEAPAVEVRGAGGWPVCVELDACCYAALRLYFRQWDREV